MKKVIILTLFFLFGLNYISAQDCSLCGEWTTTRRVSESLTSRIHIKIRKAGNVYYVQVKEVNSRDANDKYYWNECRVTNVTEECISWESMSHVIDDDWNENDKYNGYQINSATYYNVCIAKVENGVLHLKTNIRADYYGIKGGFIGSEYNTDKYGNPYWIEYELFKDENDW